MPGRPFESAASELVDEGAHPVEQLGVLEEKAADLESLGDTDAVIECRIKQLALQRVLRYLYDFPLPPLVRAQAALAEAYAKGGFPRQANEHLGLAREMSFGGVMDDAQCQRLRADLLIAEGVIRLAEERAEEARRLLSEASRVVRETYGEVDARCARVHTLLGQLEQQRGRTAEALGHFSEVSRVHQELGDEGVAAVRAQLRVAEALYLTGAVEEALELQGRAVEQLRSSNSLPEVLVDSSAQLARWLEACGRDREALEALQAAERAVAENLGPEAPRAVDVKRDAALLHLKLGEHALALQCLNEVHYLERRLHGSRSASVARTLKALGTVHLVQRNVVEAEQCLLQALRIFEADHPPNGAIIRDIHAKLESIAAMPPG